MQPRRFFRPAAVPALALLALLPVLSFACGGDGNEGPAPIDREPLTPFGGQLQPQPQPAQELDPEPASPSDDLIDVVAQNTAFRPNNLAVPLGQPVTIRLTNGDSVPHSLRIAGPDGQFDTEDDAVTEPESIDPGASGELVFSPLLAGAYTFRCNFHPDRMGGSISAQ